MPESNPAVLGDWFIYLSVVVLVCGVVAITALNFGARLTDPVVRFPTLIGATLMVPLSADAGVRTYRSAWAWLPINTPRGLARFVWAAVLGATFLASIAAIALLVTA